MADGGIAGPIVKRALFLTDGITSASSRFRVRPYLSRLRADGWEAVERPCEPEIDRWPASGGVSGRWRRFVSLTRKVSHRKRSMRDAAAFDIVVVQRELMPFMTPRLEQRLASRNKNIVYDIDDALFQKYGKREPNPVAETMRLSRAVIAGNQWLLEWALPHNPNAHLIPTPIDTERWSPAAPRTPFMPNGQEWALVVAWSGPSSDLPNLLPIAAALQKAKTRVPRMTFRVVCDRPPPDDIFPGAQFVPWSELAEVEAVRSADIAILPLPDDAGAKGHCGPGLVQAMSCGLPTIASSVGACVDMLDGGCGLAARGAAEWEEALVRLLTDAAMRREMGGKARSRAVHQYSVEAMYPIWKAAIESALV